MRIWQQGSTLLFFGLMLAAPRLLAQVPSSINADLHIFLLMGQSNMVGRDVRGLATQVGDPRVFALNTQGQWTVAHDPLFEDTEIPVGRGPGIPFALAILKAHPTWKIGLVPCAVGGTPLRRWEKAADLYQRCLAMAKTAAAAGAIDGVLWHQGEADCSNGTDAVTYERRLTEMFRDFRSEIDLPQLPIVVGQIGLFLQPAKFPYAETVRTALSRLPADLSFVGYASSNDLKDKGDSLHFDAASQDILGQRYAKALEGLRFASRQSVHLSKDTR